MEQPYLCCEICDLWFSCSRHPRNLPCGHSICTSCLDQILNLDKKCPECRSNLGSKLAAQFPVNYPLLRICSALFVSERSCANVEDFKSLYRTDLKRCLMQADQIKTKLENEETSIVNCIKDSVREIEKHEAEIEKMREAVTLLNEKQSEVASKKSSLVTITAMIKQSESTIEQVNSVAEMTDVIDEIANHKAEFDKFKLVWMTEKEKLTTLLFERRMAVADKYARRELVMEAIRGGHKIYATVTQDGTLTSRFAEVKLEDEKVLLFSLRDGHPPSEGFRLQYDVVRALTDPHPPMVFFDIVVNGTAQGRIYMNLLDDAGRTLQFLYLCTAERGPSYANTCFFEFANKGYGNKIWGGDYENNDGSGGAALPGMNRGQQNYQDIVPGLVCGYYYAGYGDDHNPSQFCIYLDEARGCDMSGLGRIVNGLDIAKNISKLENIRDALISDCGMMLFNS